VSVTVVIPTWNRAATLGDAVRSVLAQTVPPLEVLVCDDGSTDGSEEVVRSIGDPRVRWIPGEHSGRPAVPRNRGIEAACGEWLAFLDSDDAWLPKKLEKQLSLAAESGCRASCSNAYRIVPGKGKGGLLLQGNPSRIAFDDLLRGNHVICSSALVETSLVRRASGFPEALEMKALEDYALWLRIATMSDFACFPGPLLRYKDDPANSLRREDPDPSVQRVKVFRNFLSWGERAGVPRRFLSTAGRALRDEWDPWDGPGPWSPAEGSGTIAPLKILHTVEFYPPSVGGMQEVVRQLSERLVRRGHDVTVATSRVEGREGDVHNGVRIREFDVSGNLVEGMKGDVSGYRKFLKAGGFDVMTNFAAQQWATDAAITMLETIPARKVFVPTGFSRLYERRYRDYFRSMREWMRQYDLNVFLSGSYRDAVFARENGIENRVLIPNGAGEDEFRHESGINIRERLGIHPEVFLILHVGSHTGSKGHREALEIFRRAHIANAVFLLAGNEMGGCEDTCRATATKLNASRGFRVAGKRVIVGFLSREETVAAFRAADLFLFPSNVECSPLVLFEAAASGTPFLSTDVGNAAEIAGWTSGGVILPTDKGEERDGGEAGVFSRIRRRARSILKFMPAPIPPGHSRARIGESSVLLERIHGDPERRRRMGQVGRKAWEDRFTWERISGRYEKTYAALVEGKSGGERTGPERASGS
jgi:glycosyltransferase involved in cell wall biosynthesis